MQEQKQKKWFCERKSVVVQCQQSHMFWTPVNCYVVGIILEHRKQHLAKQFFFFCCLGNIAACSQLPYVYLSLCLFRTNRKYLSGPSQILHFYKAYWRVFGKKKFSDVWNTENKLQTLFRNSSDRKHFTYKLQSQKKIIQSYQ